MSIFCLGLSHNTAPVELREQLSFSPSAAKAALARFGCGRGSRPHGIAEFAVLSTCNRLELYACASGDPSAAFRALHDLLTETRGVPVGKLDSHLYRLAELDVVQHLCRVAGGLDSMIVGEPQILGQVADAFEAAVGAGAMGAVLSAAFRAAIRAGKRARTETGIARNPASVSSVAVRAAEQIFGELASRHVLVVGAGEMGELAVEALRARGVQQIAVANRTRQRAIELAEKWGGQPLSFEQLAEAMREADIVITSTGAPHTIVSPAMAREAMNGRARPLVFLDIAMPRDVDPAVAEIPGVHVFDIDHLQDCLDGAIADRHAEIPRVEQIVAEEVSAFETWLRGVEIAPVIADLRAKAEHIRQRELVRTLRHLPDLDPETLRHIEHLSESLINKLLHEPTRQLRAEAGNGNAAEYAHTVRRLFGLSLQTPPFTAMDNPE